MMAHKYFSFMNQKKKIEILTCQVDNFLGAYLDKAFFVRDFWIRISPNQRRLNFFDFLIELINIVN